MCRDRLLAAGLAGLAGTLTDGVLYWVPVLAGVADAGNTTGYYLAEIIFAANELAAAQILVGELAHFIVGGALGIAALILLQSYGHDYTLAKGVALGAVFWLVHTIVVPGFVAARIMIVHGVSEVLFDLVALIVWGVVATVTLTRLIPSPLPGLPRRQLTRQSPRHGPDSRRPSTCERRPISRSLRSDAILPSA